MFTNTLQLIENKPYSTHLEKVYRVYLDYLSQLDPLPEKVANIQKTMSKINRGDAAVQKKFNIAVLEKELDQMLSGKPTLADEILFVKKSLDDLANELGTLDQSDLNNQLGYITHFMCELDCYAALFYKQNYTEKQPGRLSAIPISFARDFATRKKVLEQAINQFNANLEILLKASTQRNLMLETILKPVLKVFEKSARLELSSHYIEVLESFLISKIYNYKKNQRKIKLKRKTIMKNSPNYI